MRPWSLVSPVAVAAVIVLLVHTPLWAQSAGPENWEVTIAPYLMGASISGTQTVRGRDIEIDVSASDIFSNLQFGAMGFVVARKGDWGVGTDLVWSALGTSIEQPPTNVDFDQGLFAFYGLRRLGPAAEITFGLRVNYMMGILDFKSLQFTVEQSKTWVDPIVGLQLRSSRERRAIVRLYTEVGGFGIGSDFAWQIFPSIGFRVGERASVDLGYRWLDVDYVSGEGVERFAYNTLMQGPVGGVTF